MKVEIKKTEIKQLSIDEKVSSTGNPYTICTVTLIRDVNTTKSEKQWRTRTTIDGFVAKWFGDFWHQKLSGFSVGDTVSVVISIELNQSKDDENIYYNQVNLVDIKKISSAPQEKEHVFGEEKEIDIEKMEAEAAAKNANAERSQEIKDDLPF